MEQANRHPRKQSFLEGAAVLMLANLLVKVIGAFYQIPLQNLIGGEQSPTFGLFSAAYRIYTAMLIISTVGLPAALSKMVAEATARGREHEARRMVRVAAGLFIPVGAVCSLALFFGAGRFAAWIQNPDARFAVMAVSPSVLMVAILSVFRGSYQGRSNMVPTAVSQVIEALGKLLIGLALARYALSQGMQPALVAAMAVLGVTVGEAAAVLYMLGQALYARYTLQKVAGLTPQSRTSAQLARTLLGLAIPVTISSAVMSLTDLIDVGLISTRLQSAAVGLSPAQAMADYGIYTSMAVTFFNLPQTLITALAVSVLPTISGACAARNEQKVRDTLAATLRLTMMLTLPAGAGFMLLSTPILQLFYREGTALGGQLMALLGPAIPAVALVAVTNAVLQAFGRIDLPLISMFCGALVKIFGDYTLIGDPRFAILGAPISTALCYWLVAALNLFQIARISHALPSFGRTVGRPLAATIGMAAATYLAYTVLGGVLALPGKLATLGAIAVAVVVYAMLLLSLGAIAREDVLLLPKGKKIADRLHLK